MNMTDERRFIRRVERVRQEILAHILRIVEEDKDLPTMYREALTEKANTFLVFRQAGWGNRWRAVVSRHDGSGQIRVDLASRDKVDGDYLINGIPMGMLPWGTKVSSALLWHDLPLRDLPTRAWAHLEFDPEWRIA